MINRSISVQGQPRQQSLGQNQQFLLPRFHLLGMQGLDGGGLVVAILHDGHARHDAARSQHPPGRGLHDLGKGLKFWIAR